jgi:hypothetical protein
MSRCRLSNGPGLRNFGPARASGERPVDVVRGLSVVDTRVERTLSQRRVGAWITDPYRPAYGGITQRRQVLSLEHKPRMGPFQAQQRLWIGLNPKPPPVLLTSSPAC